MLQNSSRNLDMASGPARLCSFMWSARAWCRAAGPSDALDQVHAALIDPMAVVRSWDHIAVLLPRALLTVESLNPLIIFWSSEFFSSDVVLHVQVRHPRGE